ncbi:hypothetical protein D3C81_523490 [compost metagenome]
MASFSRSDFLGDPIGFFHRLQRPFSFNEKQPCFRRRLQPTTFAHEQLQARLMLQIGDGAANGGLGNTQQLCRSGHRAVDHQSSEALELPDSHGIPYRFSLYRGHFILLV